jgi:MFS family permease
MNENIPLISVINSDFKHNGLILFFLSFVATLNYYDRGAFAGLIPIIKDEVFDNNEFYTGISGSIFILGYSLSSPIIAYFSRYTDTGKILMISILLWSISIALTGIVKNALLMIFVRGLTGIGEAGFMILSPPLIDDIAPQKQKAKWLAVYFSAIPIGYALGYMGAGIIQLYIDWSWVFISLSLFTVPFIVLSYFLPTIKHTDNLFILEEISYTKTILKVLENKFWLLMTLGYCAITFFLGAVLFWIVDYILIVYKDDYQVEHGKISFLIGIFTCVNGILGNLISSTLLDYLSNKYKNRLFMTVCVCLVFISLTLPFIFSALFIKNLYVFLSLFFFGELFLLCTITPINSYTLIVVQEDLRPYSMALVTFAIHLFGDLWSPTLYGLIATYSNVFYSMLFIDGWLLWTIITWSILFVYSKKHNQIYDSILDNVV